MARLSADGTKILENYDRFTGVPFNATKVTTWYDGSVMDDSKVDNVIYFKNTVALGGGYSKRDYDTVINIAWFGAVGDGVADDTFAIQQAIDFGGDIQFNGKYRITAALQVNRSCSLFSFKSQSEFISDTKVFDLYCTDFNVDNFKHLVTDRFIMLHNNFNSLTIINCFFDCSSSTLARYIVTNATSLPLIQGNNFSMFNNNANNVTPVLISAYIKNVHIVGNMFTNVKRYVFRNISEFDEERTVGNLFFNENNVLGVNTLSDQSQVARCIQVYIEDTIYITNNTIKDLLTSSSGSILYENGGSWVIENNRIFNIQGDTFAFHDKGRDLTVTTVFRGNYVEQPGAGLTTRSILHALHSSNYIITENIFVGLRCPVFAVRDTTDSSEVSSNIEISNNNIFKHRYPVVFELLGSCKDVVISYNSIMGFDNYDNVNFNGTNICRLVECYVSGSEGVFENIQLKKNNVSGVIGICTLVHLNQISISKIGTGIFVLENICDSLTSFFRGRTASCLDVFVFNNIAYNKISAAVIFDGVLPFNSFEELNRKSRNNTILISQTLQDVTNLGSTSNKEITVKAVKISSGDAIDPSFKIGDTGTPMGFFKKQTHQIGIGINGSLAAYFSAIGNAGKLNMVQSSIGNTAAGRPAYTFSGNDITGMYLHGTGILGFTTNGVSALIIDSSQKIKMQAGASVAIPPVETNDVARKAEIDLMAPSASPIFTGIPRAPTAAIGINTNQLATTAYVKNEIDSFIKYGDVDLVLDGTSTVYNISHGMGSIPSSLSMTFGDSTVLELITSLRTLTSTHIVITCASPPAARIVKIYWQVFK